MSFRQVHTAYLILVVLMPALAALALAHSLLWAGGVLVGALLLSLGPAQPVFRALLRVFVDRSPETLKNTALRFGTESGDWRRPSFQGRLQHVYPRLQPDDLKQLEEMVAAIRSRLRDAAEQIDNGAVTEEVARALLKADYPFLDEGNLGWLNARSRPYIRKLTREA